MQDGVELHPTFGWPHERLVYLLAGGDAALVRSLEGAEDDAGGRAGRRRWRCAPAAADVVIAVAASGTTAFTRAAQAAARAAGALTIGMANNPDAPLLAEAEIPVLLHTGPEFLAGSTRMTAGTAQKMALNLLSTQLMIELGRVYQGLMVNVVAGQRQARRPQPPHRPGDRRLQPRRRGRGLGARRPGHQAGRAAARRARPGDGAGTAGPGPGRPAPRAPDPSANR